ncbi:hypothetical protein BLOT_004574 [Blomia tropicalis]|nr:hypothetical protein BLOT_004574 [Blomia tropicalis]
MSSVITTPTSVSSFFSSFGGSGNSPPPLTPNGILSGLHSFLFADSGALGLDAFDIGSSTDVACLLPSTNPQYILPNTQPASGQVTVPSSSQAAVTTGLNPTQFQTRFNG